MNKNKSRKELFEEYEKNYLKRLENPTIENEKNESEITDEEDEYKKDFFDYSRYLLVTFYIIYLGVALFLFFGPRITFLNELFPNYTEYYEPIRISIPVIIGLIAVVIIFYLGKFRDYKRDYIKQVGIYCEITEKIVRAYGSVERSFDTELIKTNDEIIDEIDDIEDDYKDFTKKLVHATLWMVGIFVTLTAAISTADQSQNNFLIIFASMIFAAGLFVFLWLLNEKRISDFEIGLANITINVGILKGMFESQIENLKK